MDFHFLAEVESPFPTLLPLETKIHFIMKSQLISFTSCTKIYYQKSKKVRDAENGLIFVSIANFYFYTNKPLEVFVYHHNPIDVNLIDGDYFAFTFAMQILMNV